MRESDSLVFFMCKMDFSHLLEWLVAGSEAVCVTMKRSVTQAQTMCTGIFQHLSSVAGQGTTHKLWGGGCWRKGEGPQALLQSPGWKDLGQCFLTLFCDIT